MKDNYIYTTSQLAKQYDLTPKGLAFYEKHGLVSPSREQNNKYRSFNLEDCYCLHFSKFYKNVGLSINETVELEKNGNMDTIMGTINSSCETKMKQIDEEIMIIKAFRDIVSRLEEYKKYGQQFKITRRPEFDRLHVRYYDETHIINDKSSAEFVKWNKYTPINAPSLLYSFDRVNSNEDLMNVDVANGIFSSDFDLLGFDRSENVKHYDSVKCIETIICGDALKINNREWLLSTLDYIKKHNYELADDIITKMLIVTGKNDNRIRYDVAYFPISD